MNRNALLHPLLLTGLLLAIAPAWAEGPASAASLPDYPSQVREQLQQRLEGRLERDMSAEYRPLDPEREEHRLAVEEGRLPIALPLPRPLTAVPRAPRITVPAGSAPQPSQWRTTLI